MTRLINNSRFTLWVGNLIKCALLLFLLEAEYMWTLKPFGQVKNLILWSQCLISDRNKQNCSTTEVNTWYIYRPNTPKMVSAIFKVSLSAKGSGEKRDAYVYKDHATSGQLFTIYFKNGLGYVNLHQQQKLGQSFVLKNSDEKSAFLGTLENISLVWFT